MRRNAKPGPSAAQIIRRGDVKDNRQRNDDCQREMDFVSERVFRCATRQKIEVEHAISEIAPDAL